MGKKAGSMAVFMSCRMKRLTTLKMMTLCGNKGPIERLTHERQLIGYRHERFWSCMDTLKEKAYLEDLWQSGKAPWKMW